MKPETYQRKLKVIADTYFKGKLDEAQHLARRCVQPAIKHYIEVFLGCDHYTAYIIANYLKTGTGLYKAIEAEKEFRNKKIKIIN